ncbi:MAG: efflux RND transporter periplasmic adaptor subunit [Devosiaceae bacterium]|nr:efflux RND transporter periplasmic adaptor subunit [Devosiaceae bacterium]
MMRYIMSYGAALLLILLIAGWLASGTLIQGGRGPGNGEQEIVGLIEPNENGPVRRLFASLGLIEQEPTEGISVAAIEEAQTPDSEIAATEEIQNLQTVRYENFTAQLMPIEVELRGQTEANAVVSVRAQTSGIVKQVHVTKGQTVNPGDLLCSIERGTREAKLSQAEASLAQAEASQQQAQADFDTNLSLREKGLSPANTARQFEVSLRAANASLRAAIASLDDVKTDLEYTQVRTEISGIVKDPLVNIGDMLSNSGVCATIVQYDPMLFTGQISETKINLIKNGMLAKVTTITNQQVQGKVRYISSSAERATRSFEVEIELENSNAQLLDGVTATAKIIVGEMPAHLIPQSALTLETDGTLGVRILLDDVVKFVPVQIVGDETGGVWIGGLPQSIKLITLGQEYVIDGQQVLASLDQENTAGEGSAS